MTRIQPKPLEKITFGIYQNYEALRAKFADVRKK
jgi:hypothetical protein